MNRGWDPIFPVCDGNAHHLWASIRPGRRLGARTNQRLASGIGVFSQCRVVSTRGKLGLLPRLMEVLDMRSDLWTGHETLYPPKVELAQYTNHGNSGNRPTMRLGFSHRAGRYQPGWYPGSSPGCRSCRCVDGFRSRHLTLSCPRLTPTLCIYPGQWAISQKWHAYIFV